MATSRSWLDDFFGTPSIEAPDGTVLPKRGNLRFLGGGVSVGDNSDADETDITIPGGGAAPVPTGTGFRHVTAGVEDAAAVALQLPGIIPFALSGTAYTIDAISARYSGIRFTGTPPGPVTFTLLAPSADAYGGSGCIYAFYNETAQTVTLTTGTGTTQQVGPGLSASFGVDTTGVWPTVTGI